MYILLKWSTNSEGEFEINEVICASMDKGALTDRHKKEARGILIDLDVFPNDLRQYCKRIGQPDRYYRESGYCTIEQLEVI